MSNRKNTTVDERRAALRDELAALEDNAPVADTFPEDDRRSVADILEDNAKAAGNPVLLDGTIPRVLEPVVDPELAALRAENVELKAQVAGIPTLRAPLPVQSPPFVLTGTDGLPVPNQPPALPANVPAPVFPSDTSPFDPFASF